MKKFLAASLAVFVWLMIFDHLLSNAVLGSAMASIPGVKASYSAMWEAVGDLCSALVLCGFYGRVRTVYGAGLAGGAVFGVYAGTLMSFPTWLNMTNYFGWPYRTAWHLTIIVILIYVVAGAIAGMVYKAMGEPQPAA